MISKHDASEEAASPALVQRWVGSLEIKHGNQLLDVLMPVVTSLVAGWERQAGRC